MVKMNQERRIPFMKFHGLENDWIVVDRRDLAGSASKAFLARLALRISDRHTGVGADGLIGIFPPRRIGDARVRFFNADGSEAEMSGNGIRCAGAYLRSRPAGLKSPGRKSPMRIETVAGVKSLEVVKEGNGRWIFAVGMGAPILEPAEVPFKAGKSGAPVVQYPLETSHGLFKITVTSMGNPHCTVFVDDFTPDWAAMGREIERHPLFPHRTNVEFVRLLSKTEIEVRFWERGVGPTRSSGTGSCAATVACILNGRTERQVRVKTPAGILRVAWPENGEVTLLGPAERIAMGMFYYRN